jgi:hypothetical protein
MWSTAVSGLPTELLVGDDGLLYAVTAAGVLAGLDQPAGGVKWSVTGLPEAGDLRYEAILQDGRIFVSGGGR